MGEQVVKAGSTRIGRVGTGVMGLAMCARLQADGYSITVFARTPSKASALCDKGAVLADSPATVGKQCDIVFTMLSNSEVVLRENGVLAGLPPGGILVDVTSSEPSLAREIYARASAKRCDSVDAPVTGGDRGARDGTLAVLAGGRAETVADLRPLFECIGSATFLGPAGPGQSSKIANQMTATANLAGLSEGLVLAHKAGLEVAKYLSAVSGAAAGSKVLDLFGDRSIGRDFEPGGFTHYIVKDLERPRLWGFRCQALLCFSSFMLQWWRTAMGIWVPML